MNRQSFFFLNVVGFAILLPAGAAMAQRQTGNNGRALDRNLQSGSGGVNAPGRTSRPGAYQDALITGNVGGLARFRGNIDYRAPGEFTDRTAADDTYSFRLQSLPPSVRTYQNPDLLPQHGSGSPLLLRSGSGVTSGEVTGLGNRLGTDLGTVRRDDTTGLSGRGGRSRDAASLDSPSLRGRSQSIAVRLDDRGRAYQVTASPLTGIRQQPLPGREDDPTSPLDPAEEIRPDRRGDDAQDEGADAAPQNEQRQTARLEFAAPTALLLGERLIDSERTDTRSRVSARNRYRTEVLEEAVLGRADPNAKPGEDVYQDLLSRVRGDAGGRTATASRPGDRLGSPAAGKERPKTLEEQIAEESAKIAAATGPESETEKEAFDKLMERLKYDLPAIGSLSSGTGTPFDQAMAEAEKLMSEGRFFEADAAYARAEDMPQSTPMALVGQTHAQLGAGLYRSATNSLRRLFSNHPELIAARYQPPILPPTNRLAEIEVDARDLIETEGETGLHLLMAYLAHQRGDRTQVDEALRVMAESNPDDVLVPVLQRLWGGTDGEVEQGGDTSDTKIQQERDVPEK